MADFPLATARTALDALTSSLETFFASLAGAADALAEGRHYRADGSLRLLGGAFAADGPLAGVTAVAVAIGRDYEDCAAGIGEARRRLCTAELDRLAAANQVPIRFLGDAFASYAGAAMAFGRIVSHAGEEYYERLCVTSGWTKPGADQFIRDPAAPSIAASEIRRLLRRFPPHLIGSAKRRRRTLNDLGDLACAVRQELARAALAAASVSASLPRVEPAVAAAPQLEANDDDAFVLASVLWPKYGFSSYKSFRKFVEESGVRNRSGGQRRLVHAGDVARAIAARDRAEEKATDRAADQLLAVERRKAHARHRKDSAE